MQPPGGSPRASEQLQCCENGQGKLGPGGEVALTWRMWVEETVIQKTCTKRSYLSRGRSAF